MMEAIRTGRQCRRRCAAGRIARRRPGSSRGRPGTAFSHADTRLDQRGVATAVEPKSHATLYRGVDLWALVCRVRV